MKHAARIHDDVVKEAGRIVANAIAADAIGFAKLSEKDGQPWQWWTEAFPNDPPVALV